MQNIDLIHAHGGKLVELILHGREREEALHKARSLKKIYLNKREVSDVEMIAIGGFSPLEGFMDKNDYESVVKNSHISNGLVWTIPVTLSITKEELDGIKENQEVSLCDENNNLAILHIQEIYDYDKKKEAREVFRTEDDSHPGVSSLYQQGDLLVAGKIKLLNRPQEKQFLQYRIDPKDTRKIFQKLGWKRIVGFQTRNPVHRAHEYIIKCALEVVDGLLLHPLVGETKKGDIPAEVRMRCYEVLVEKYYPKDRVVLAINPASMRYAGPREAIFHALIRKNYGCTHFIVGRDHAGVGNFYGTFDAQRIFDEFKPEDLGITPLFFDHSFWCRRCNSMATIKTCPHTKEDHLSLSGTRVRELLASGEIPPLEFTRPEVAEILIEAYRKGEF